MNEQSSGSNGSNGHHQDLGSSLRPPGRVVSLVPSLTETMFDLGLGDRVIGITDFCTRPAGALSGITRVGGPQDARLEDILALRPEIVLASRDENRRELVEALHQAGIPVWVTFPTSVEQAVGMLWELVRIFHADGSRARVDLLERAVEWARAAAENQARVRYFCPIWQDALPDGSPWWMTFNDDTYLSDVLSLAGGENIFGGRDRRYPLEADLGLAPEEAANERDTRYPRVTAAEIAAARPEVILLPNEPYAFSEDDGVRLAHLMSEYGVQSASVRMVDGSLITWYGTRLGQALSDLPAILNV